MIIPFGTVKPLLKPKEQFEVLFENIYKFKLFFKYLHIIHKKELLMIHNDFLIGRQLDDYHRETLINIEGILIGIAHQELQKLFPIKENPLG